MESSDRLAILETISQIKAIAENEQDDTANLEDFLVMPEYSRFRDPDKFLILGGRGAGKTKVFQALIAPEGFAKLIGGQRKLLSPNADNTIVIAGYKLHRDFPSSDILDQFADDKQARSYWAGSLMILLMNSSALDPQLRKIVLQYLEPKELERFSSLDCLKTPTQWLPYIQQNPEVWENILDKMDEWLDHNNQWLFVAYDSLDRLTGQYSDLFPFLRSLLSFWHTHSNRWKHLRCKIFLRNDLYLSQMLAFPDASKLSSNTVQLVWNTVSLYRLLIKRMANAGSPETISYLRRIPKLITTDSDPVLGYVPSSEQKKMEAFVEMMIGTYMGSTPKKGKSYSWPPNHLQDANGALSPRPFLKCFSVAAQDMCNHPDELDRLQDARLLRPDQIQGALLEVSEERVQELKEEYPWLEELQSAFAGLTMLMDQQEFIDHISMDFWGEQQKKSLPASTPHGIFSLLKSLGIVLIADDGRVNVPEIYLHGFRMKRKGGLRRPIRD